MSSRLSREQAALLRDRIKWTPRLIPGKKFSPKEYEHGCT